jgi:hypothetical protein
MRITLKSTLILTILFMLSLAGALAIHYATYWGPWAYSDSTEYIASARSLLAGQGLGFQAASGDFVLYSLHPPLYPLILSLLGLAGFDLLEAARWLNILLFGATVFLSGVVTYVFLRSVWPAVVLSISLLTIPVFVDVSSGAMSEPLLLFNCSLAIALLVFYLERKKGWLLIASAIAAGLAILARYQGMVVGVVCATSLLVANYKPLKQRLLDILAICLVSLLPLAAWMTWLFTQSRSLTGRGFIQPNNLVTGTMVLRKSLMEIFINWLPYRQYLHPNNYTVSRNYLLVLVLGLIILTSLIIIRRLSKRPVTQKQALVTTFSFLWGLFSIGNILLLAFTFLFTTPTPDLNQRTMLPVQFGMMFFAVLLLGSIVQEFHLPRAVGLTCGLLVLVFIYPNGQSSWRLIQQYHQFGLGYTNASWHSSLTLQAVRDLPTSTPLITNEAAAILLHLDRSAYDFCSPPCNPSRSVRYGDDLQDPVQKIFREQGAALVLFYPYCEAQSQGAYTDSLAQLATLTRDLRQAFYACDGAIFFYPIDTQN